MMDMSLESFKVWHNVLLEHSHPIDHIGKDKVGMEEVVLRISMIHSLSKDCPLWARHHCQEVVLVAFMFYFELSLFLCSFTISLYVSFTNLFSIAIFLSADYPRHSK